MTSNSFLIQFIILFFFLSCTKTEEIDKLPPITAEGKNTFGCLVNGKAWIPETDGGMFNEKLLSTYDDEVLSIQAKLRLNNNSINQIIRVRAKITDLGFHQVPPPYPRELYRNSNKEPNGTTPCTSYRCNPEDTEIEILYINTSQRIIAGKFSYKNLENDCGDVINITDGRFDVRY